MVSPSYEILEKIRAGMTVGGFDQLIANNKTTLDVWQDALKGYNRYVKLIKLWAEKRQVPVTDYLKPN